MRFPRWLAALALCLFAAVPVCAALPQVPDLEPPPLVAPPVPSTAQRQDAAGVAIVKFDAPISAQTVVAFETMLTAVEGAGAKAVLLVFNSRGGDVAAGMRISRSMEESPIPVYCVVDGEADSMGFYILQSCTLRFMTKRSTLLAHEPSNGVPLIGNRFEHERWVDSLKATALAMAEHESKRLRITKAQFLARTHDRDYVMAWEEALNIGAVDQVVGSVVEAIRAVQDRAAPAAP